MHDRRSGKANRLALFQAHAFLNSFSTTCVIQMPSSGPYLDSHWFLASKLGSNWKFFFSPKRGLSCARSTKVLTAHNPTVCSNAIETSGIPHPNAIPHDRRLLAVASASAACLDIIQTCPEISLGKSVPSLRMGKTPSRGPVVEMAASSVRLPVLPGPKSAGLPFLPALPEPVETP